ncbi:MAG: hypothetical protein ACM3O6_06875 [Acidobacteriota bacterium]
MADTSKHPPKIQEIPSDNTDPTKTHKADLFINTGKLGRRFLVTVHDQHGHPTLIAMHL